VNGNNRPDSGEISAADASWSSPNREVISRHRSRAVESPASCSGGPVGVVGLPMVLPMVGTLNEGVKPVETHRPSRFDGILRVQGGFLCVSKTEG
jgi:hypothetical protein